MTAPRSLDPHMETYANTTAVTHNTNNGLLRINPRMDGVELDLAESWKQIDALTYEFKIRKGVRWQDVPPVNGRELTSADIKYSIERVAGMHGQKSHFKHRYYFENTLASIETPDKYTIIFKTKKPFAPFISYIASPWTAIVAKEVVDEFKDLKRKAIGTGPFILKEFVRGSHIIMVKNPNYFKKNRPYLDKIQLKIMRDPAAVVSAFIAGKLDSTGAYFFQIPTIKKQSPEARIVRREGTHMWTLRCPPWIEGTKPLKPPFDKKKVRQAIAMAIDKRKLLKLAWGGFGTPQIGPVTNALKKYALPESAQVEYNPEKARKYLAESGYPNGFTAELITWNLPYMTKPAQVLKEMLGDVGIKINLKTLEMAQYFNRAYRFDYEMALHVMTAPTDPEEMLTPYFGKVDTSTFYKWSDHDIWAMIEKQSSIMDPEERVAYINKIQRKIVDESPNVFLYTQYRYSVSRPYVHHKYYLLDFQPFYAEFTWMEKH
ncbi:MAG: ABC transporter substrate-binding protein [Deltaproteobacteria bacterium]|nr:ABC transporter substrate-binding protein [Deltaproteobacteria bacterium]